MHLVEAKGLLSAQNGINIYRGCSHGCIYCDSRSNCYQMNHDFEDIEVKANAPELLESALRKKRNKCMIGTGSMTDPYLHIEAQQKLTRRCLELIDAYGFGLAIQTKSNRILRDLDLLKSINQKAKCVVQITLTTYDEELCKLIEPNVSSTKERVEVLEILRDNQIPTVVWMSPFLPWINDTKENIEGLLGYCVKAKVKGILCFGIGLTLRDGNREFFYDNLERDFPGLKEKYQKQFKNVYEIKSNNHESLMKTIYETCKKHEIMINPDQVFEYLHAYENKEYEQMQFKL